VQDEDGTLYVKEGQANDVLATSTGDRFSFRYVIPGDPSKHPAQFEYVNHTQQGSFRLHSLTWVGFSHSLTSQASPDEYDTVTCRLRSGAWCGQDRTGRGDLDRTGNTLQVSRSAGVHLKCGQSRQPR
jgi:hypothetical protein